MADAGPGGDEGDGPMRYFENIDRFWAISISHDGLTTTVRYGKHGTRGNPHGQARSKTHASPADAEIYADSLVRVKIREGYVENKTGTRAEDGGLAAALAEVPAQEDKEGVRRTRSGGTPTPRKRASTGTGKRKGKKVRTEEPGQASLSAPDEQPDEPEEDDDGEPASDDGASEREPTPTAELADYEANDVIQDTILMFEAAAGNDDGLLSMDAQELADEREADAAVLRSHQLPPSEPTVVVAPPTPTQPLPDEEPGIAPIVVPPLTPSPPPASPPAQTSAETTVEVTELTEVEATSAALSPGLDTTPALPVVREPSEERAPDAEGEAAEDAFFSAAEEGKEAA
ncbi:hypothetical protein DFJ74DRAFT_664106 [Hyaloraphidium curvatum]|nr:hypothetical protein DFJ74DRAFT_664106 [Hyaloraphidium curvatum]